MRPDLTALRIASRISSTGPGNPSVPYLTCGAGAAAGCCFFVLRAPDLAGWDQAGDADPRQWTRQNGASRNTATKGKAVRPHCLIGRFLLLLCRSHAGGAPAATCCASEPSGP